MTKGEFISAFHTFWNNINSDMAPGLTFTEVGHLATQAQEVLVRSIYNGTAGEPFESTEEARSYLDNLVRQCTLEKITDPNPISDNSVSYRLTDNGDDSHIMYIVYESVTFGNSASGCLKGKTVIVKPVSHDMYWHIKDNPFKGAGDDRVLRLTKSFVDNGKTYDVAEIIASSTDIEKYLIRYVKRPDDIEFVQGQLNEPLCELHENLHRLILNSTVSLAKSLWES